MISGSGSDIRRQAGRAGNTVIDLSRRAAETLDYTDQGRTPVRVEVLEWGEGLPLGS